MPDHPITARYRQWLLELTRLPTAAGREGRVVEWVRAWARRRRSVEIAADAFGNLVLRRRGPRRDGPPPIYFTAHMDHPAFVVREVVNERRVHAQFLGGVRESYFRGAAVLLHHDGRPPQRGKVIDFVSVQKRESWGAGNSDKIVAIELGKRAAAAEGDVITWDTGRQRVRGDRLFTMACDDLAGVAAALAAFDALLRRPRRGGRGDAGPDVRVLLTRAEEVGFVGAIAACKAGTMPKDARLIALENSKSFPESPIGAGPIVRVGDRTSTFDPDLTYRVGRVAEQLAAAEGSFEHQRKLMPGGTCEASAYQAYGYTATCLCLPLGNYHNMNEATGRIDAETISLGDYHGLVRLLIAVATALDDPKEAPSLRARLERTFAERRRLVEA